MKTKTTSALFTSLLAACLSVGSAWTAHAQSDLFATVNDGGTGNNGASSIFRYTPAGVQSTFASNLDTPRGLAFDSAGNLFVATNHDYYDAVNGIDNFEGTILKITPDGLMSTFATGFPSDFFLQGVATDSTGNVFVVGQSFNNNPSPGTISKVAPDGTISAFPMLPGEGWGLACSAGYVYVATSDSSTSTANGEILKFMSDGTQTSTFIGPAVFPYPSPGPLGLAFDSGNLFVSASDDNTQQEILKFAPNGTEITPPRFATGLTNSPHGLACDSAGNLFVAEKGVGGTTTPGDILKFKPDGTKSTFASGIGSRGNRGPEFLAFPPPNTPVASNVTTTVTITSEATSPGTTTVTPIADPSSVGPLPTGIEFDPNEDLAFEITASPGTYTATPIIIAVQVLSVSDQNIFNQLQILHWNGASWDNVTASNPARDWSTKTIYASVTTLSPFAVAKETLSAQVQQPINADGSSVFSVKRGVVPVAFTLTSKGVATCQLPPAKISVIRTAGTVTGSIDESTYMSKADKGSNFRISNCQYVYNLAASSLGTGTYKVNILIGGTVVGSGTFALK